MHQHQADQQVAAFHRVTSRNCLRDLERRSQTVQPAKPPGTRKADFAAQGIEEVEKVPNFLVVHALDFGSEIRRRLAT